MKWWNASRVLMRPSERKRAEPVCFVSHWRWQWAHFLNGKPHVSGFIYETGIGNSEKTAVKLRSGIDCQKWSGLEYWIILQYSTQNLDRNENTFNLRYHHRPTKSELRARLVEIKFYGNRVYFFSAIMHEFLADSKQVNKLSKRPVSWLLSLITYVHPVVLCHFIHIIDHPY